MTYSNTQQFVATKMYTHFVTWYTHTYSWYTNPPHNTQYINISSSSSSSVSLQDHCCLTNTLNNVVSSLQTITSLPVERTVLKYKDRIPYQTKPNKMLSYRRETALQGAL